MKTSAEKPVFQTAIPIDDGVNLMDVAVTAELFFDVREFWTDREAVVSHVAENSGRVVTRDGTTLFPHQTFADPVLAGDLRPLLRRTIHPSNR